MVMVAMLDVLEADAASTGNHTVRMRKYVEPDVSVTVRYNRNPRMKLLPAGGAVGSALIVTVCPSRTSASSDGSLGIDSSPHGVIHV